MFDFDNQHYYNRARWYNPYNGRFNRTDPYAGNTQDPQSLHKYLYCHANPINATDPSGESGEFSLVMSLMVFAIMAILMNATTLNAPTVGGTIHPDDSGDMILSLFIAMALVPICVVGGKIISGLKAKYLRWRGKSTTVIFTSKGEVGVPGKTIGNATFVNPGPLTDDLASTFSGGRYTIVKTSEPVHLYRVWGGQAKEFGAFWSTIPPEGSLAAKIDNALIPQWGNTATKWTVVEVPKGTMLYIGSSAYQAGAFVGGTPQVIVGTKVTEAMKIASGLLQ